MHQNLEAQRQLLGRASQTVVGVAFRISFITDDLNGPEPMLCEKDMILPCDSEGPDMNLESFRNILTKKNQEMF